MSVVEKIKTLRSTNELNFEKCLELKANGRPLPELQIRQTSKSNNREVYRKFRTPMYDFADWICGCDVTNAFYCFSCLIFSNNTLWCKTGVTDLKHLKEKVKKHSLSAEHMKSSVHYATIGNVDIKLQLDDTQAQSIKEFNENVSKNRYILHKIIDCVKFCGAFGLAMRAHDESDSSKNPGVFRGLIDFVAELDPIFKEYLEKATVFKGTSTSVQNDLLDSMLAVTQEQIKQEIQSVDYIAVQVNETIDGSNKTQMVFIIRYALSGVVYERFFKFLNPTGTTAEQRTDVILRELEILEIDKTPEKLIGQSYDEMSEINENKIKERYPAANFVHCYEHRLNSILQKAVSQDKSVKVFFASLHGFSAFFSRSPQRTAVLDEIVNVRLQKALTRRWNFSTRCIETLFLHKEDVLYCLEKIIQTEEDYHSISQALALEAFLESEDFLFWLNFFHLVMPRCEKLFNQLQQRKIDVSTVKECIDSFKSSMQTIRDNVLNNLSSDASSHSTNVRKRRQVSDEDSKRRVVMEVCEIIISEMSHRFSFSDHLIIGELFYNDRFATYKEEFPDGILNLVKKDFPSVNYPKLKSELTVIYDRDDFHRSSGAPAMLQLFLNSNLCGTFSETVKLLNILCTLPLPMTIAESERCSSSLKKVKTFLRNAMGQERLSALSMLSIEKTLIRSITDYNERVIDHFANSKERRIVLKFKSV